MAVQTSRTVELVVAAPATRARHTVEAALALAVGTAASGFLLPVGVTLLVGATGLVGVLVACAGAGRIRAALVAHARRRARARHRRDRQRVLAAATLGEREALAELVRLADQIEASAPELMVRFELEDLLDRYAALAVAHERTLRAATMVDRAELERARDACPDSRRVELFARRLRFHDRCRARADTLANELALLADFMRLLAQRAACPEELALDDRIESQLAELDEDDAAESQLASELR